MYVYLTAFDWFVIVATIIELPLLMSDSKSIGNYLVRAPETVRFSILILSYGMAGFSLYLLAYAFLLPVIPILSTFFGEPIVGDFTFLAIDLAVLAFLATRKRIYRRAFDTVGLYSFARIIQNQD